MAPEEPTSRLDEAAARREFLKQVGKAAATAPAIALLLAASSKPASAGFGPACYAPDFDAQCAGQ